MHEEGSQGSLESLVARLSAIGLEEKDALLYVQLCLLGPTKASDAASAAKLNRTEAYRALDNLIRRGFVTASLDRPTLYEATAPEKVFDDALAAHLARRATIESARNEAICTLDALRQNGGGTPLKSAYKLIQGRTAIYAAVEAMVRRATHSQKMASTYFAAPNATDTNTPYVTTLQRAREGLRMNLLVQDSPGLDKAIRELVEQPSVRVRTFEPGHPIRFTIVDDREILIWLVTDPAPGLTARDDVAMWTNAHDFVRMHMKLYEALWVTGRDMR